MGVSVCYGSALLGTIPVWLWGSHEQKQALATDIIDGGLACFALSEREHGSDLRATETVLEWDGEELLLSGTKWPAGNACRSRYVTVFARSGAESFSLVLIDKESLPADTWSALPQVKTLGLKGHDLSGLSFSSAPVGSRALLGEEGMGLAQAMKTLQITRTMTTALSLGAMDAALRIGLEYAQQRVLYGDSIFALPPIRAAIIHGHIDLLIAEAVALPVARALTARPERLSLWSSVAKYLVPVIADETIASMAAVLGARSYLCEGFADGVFQKLRRDHEIASIFDGTSHVNLALIAGQLSALARRLGTGLEADMEAAGDDPFQLTGPAPDWLPDGRRFRLSNAGRDEVAEGWEGAVRDLADLEDCPGTSQLIGTCTEIGRLRASFYASLATGGVLGPSSAWAQEAAARHCVFHAMSSCLLTWQRNRERLGGYYASGEWLVLCLQRLLQRIAPTTTLEPGHLARFADVITFCGESGAAFSLTSLGRW
jgi:alkylation response protein AidB-like acyl-CoA dehydrogenase